MDNRIIKLSQGTIDAINGELLYVATLNAQGRSDNTHHGVEGQLLTLKHYTDRAIHAWVMNPGSMSSLHELRKCAAIAVRALETEGCPHREVSHG